MGHSVIVPLFQGKRLAFQNDIFSAVSAITSDNIMYDGIFLSQYNIKD